MNVDDLKRERDFQQLTDQQKKFILEYCSNGGLRIPAAHKAYNCKNDASATSIAHNCLHNKRIAYLVAKYFGYDSNKHHLHKDEFLGLLAERVRDRKTPANFFVALANMYKELAPWAVQPPAAPAPPPEERAPVDIDTLVREMEQKGASNE
jgi:hypothetical protein